MFDSFTAMKIISQKLGTEFHNEYGIDKNKNPLLLFFIINRDPYFDTSSRHPALIQRLITKPSIF